MAVCKEGGSAVTSSIPPSAQAAAPRAPLPAIPAAPAASTAALPAIQHRPCVSRSSIQAALQSISSISGADAAAAGKPKSSGGKTSTGGSSSSRSSSTSSTSSNSNRFRGACNDVLICSDVFLPDMRQTVPRRQRGLPHQLLPSPRLDLCSLPKRRAWPTREMRAPISQGKGNRGTTWKHAVVPNVPRRQSGAEQDQQAQTRR